MVSFLLVAYRGAYLEVLGDHHQMEVDQEVKVVHLVEDPFEEAAEADREVLEDQEVQEAHVVGKVAFQMEVYLEDHQVVEDATLEEDACRVVACLDFEVAFHVACHRGHLAMVGEAFLLVERDLGFDY